MLHPGNAVRLRCCLSLLCCPTAERPGLLAPRRAADVAYAWHRHKNAESVIVASQEWRRRGQTSTANIVYTLEITAACKERSTSYF